MIQDSMREATGTNTDTRTDEQILRDARVHPEVFGILVSRYEAPFMRKAVSILRSKEDAEEVVQDAFTRIYVYADRYQAQAGASFSSWGYMILTRLALTRYQKLKSKNARFIELEPEAYERLSEEGSFLDGLTKRDEVLMALAKIPEQAARVLTLQFLEGKTQEEIAESEGSTVPAIKTRVHRAKKLLKEALTHNAKPYE